MEQEVKKIDIQLSMIVSDLDNGFTWKTSEDVGYGSIQTKYNLKDFQVEIIRKHPKLKDLKPNIVLINIIDDLGEINVAPPPPPQKVEVNLESPTPIQTTADDIKSFMTL
jgi:hypothetical protein